MADGPGESPAQSPPLVAGGGAGVSRGRSTSLWGSGLGRTERQVERRLV